MSENNITESEEDLKVEQRKTLRIAVDLKTAQEFLDKIDAPTPDASDLDEIVLVIKKDD